MNKALKAAASKLPERVKGPLRRLRDVLERTAWQERARLCPVCGKAAHRFNPYGKVPREDAQCPHCGALERHRFFWLFLQKNTDLFNGRPKKMLHVAPESCFEPRFRERLGSDYLTADLHNPHAMVKMDITDIRYPDQSFDVIYCSHVLEHVPDDRQAMREFFRVLKNSGWAVLLVPITGKQTFEDPSIVDPAMRLKAFGQEDHVRRYGPDYADRLRDAGFAVKVFKVSDLADARDAERMGLTRASGDIYYCTK